MGIYTYFVTSEIVTDREGNQCNLAEFAFKENRYWTDAEYGAAQRKAGIAKAMKAVDAVSFTGRVSIDGGETSVTWATASLTDAAYDRKLEKIKEAAERDAAQNFQNILARDLADTYSTSALKEIQAAADSAAQMLASDARQNSVKSDHAAKFEALGDAIQAIIALQS